MSRWTVDNGLAVCPECAFSFSAEHTDADGRLSCPVCVEARLSAALERIAERRPETWEAQEARRALDGDIRCQPCREGLHAWHDTSRYLLGCQQPGCPCDDEHLV